MTRLVRTVAVALAVGVVAAACTDDSGTAEALCATVAEGEGLATTFRDFDPTDPVAALDDLRSARVALGDLLDAAPEEVRDDLQVEIDYVQALIDALDPVEPGDAAQAALQVQAVTEAHPGVDVAAQELAAFTEREC